MNAPLSTAPAQPARVLLAEASLSYRRVVREALTSFYHCEVDDTPLAERAFEMALHCPYDLFIFASPLPDFSGELLDRLLVRAYPLAHRQRHSAPPVVFLIPKEDGQQRSDLRRDARVRGLIPHPPQLESLLGSVANLLPKRPISSH